MGTVPDTIGAGFGATVREGRGRLFRRFGFLPDVDDVVIRGHVELPKGAQIIAAVYRPKSVIPVGEVRPDSSPAQIERPMNSGDQGGAELVAARVGRVSGRCEQHGFAPARLWSAPSRWKRVSGSASRCQTITRIDLPTATMAFASLVVQRCLGSGPKEGATEWRRCSLTRPPPQRPQGGTLYRKTTFMGAKLES